MLVNGAPDNGQRLAIITYEHCCSANLNGTSTGIVPFIVAFLFIAPSPSLSSPSPPSLPREDWSEAAVAIWASSTKHRIPSSMWHSGVGHTQPIRACKKESVKGSSSGRQPCASYHTLQRTLQWYHVGIMASLFTGNLNVCWKGFTGWQQRNLHRYALQTFRERKPSVTSGFVAQRASTTESISCRHYEQHNEVFCTRHFLIYFPKKAFWNLFI